MTDEQHPELSARLEEVIRPTPTDARRATRAVLRALDDRQTHRTGALIAAGVQALGAPPDVHPMEITFHGHVGPDEIAVDDPVVRHLRARLAAQGAIAELAAQGLVIRAFDPGGNEPREGVIGENLRVGIAHSRGRFGVRVDLALPHVEDVAFMLVSSAASRWYLEPTLFLEELGGLHLDDRTVRTLREGLGAFRRGLYLASASLLAVVSEAAWYKAAERLVENEDGPALEKAMRDGNTGKTQTLVADRLRAVKGLSSTLPDELLAQASVLREIRNYGVHPGPEKDELERWFSEEACGLLVLDAHNYLARLSGAVDQAIEQGPPPGATAKR